MVGKNFEECANYCLKVSMSNTMNSLNTVRVKPIKLRNQGYTEAEPHDSQH